MPTLASAAELSLFVGHDVAVDRAGRLLEMATSAVLEAAPVAVEPTTETVEVDGTGTCVVLLPSWPVTDVASVEVDGETVDPDDYHWSRAGIIELTHRWSAVGVVTVGYGVWPRRRQAVSVTFTHGFDEPPEALKTACLAVAARLEVNPQGLTDFQGADIRTGFDGGVRLTADERAMVSRALR